MMPNALTTAVCRALRTVLLGVVLFSLESCGDRGTYVTVDGAVWNTTYSIKFRGDGALADSVLTVMRQVEMSLSPFNPRSAVSLINSNEQMTVDTRIEAVFSLSQEVNRLSGGAFDPTLSPVINLWGFGYTGHDAPEPADSVIRATLSVVGIDSCRIADGKMYKKSPATTFNFSAVTKGYGCDEIARMLCRNGVDDYMIEIGGELALGGLNDRGEPWRVMIDAPVESLSAHSRLVTIPATDCGIATSGNYRNYRDTGGRRVGHTISPATGYPVETSTLSATVIAPTCAMADALATACMAMPAADALAMIERIEGVECLLVIGTTDAFETTQTSGFPQ